MARRTSGRDFAFRRTHLFAAIAGALAQGALAGSFAVINSNDGGTGSLRQAIYDANYDCTEMGITSSTIVFNGGPFVIKPSFPLPAFDCAGRAAAYNVSLDASVAYGAVLNSDPTGFNATFGVTLDGSSNFYGGTCGLQYIDNGYGGQLGVKGMEIANFNYGASGWGICGGSIYAIGNRLANNGNGMSIANGSIIGTGNTADRNVIIGSAPYYGAGISIASGNYSIVNNFIGTPDGTSASPNETAIYWSCCGSVSGSIGYNVLVSSGYADIDIGGDLFSIYNNKIGTNVGGTSVLGSASYGISIYYSYGSSISQNVIAGAASNGIDLWQSNNVSITDNKIGVSVDGSVALGNDIGIYDDGSSFTSIYGNSISGNSSYGIWLTGVNSATVDANFIGTNYGGTLAVPNVIGVYLGQAATASFTGNTISGNSNAGFWSSDASNITLNGNFIGTTTGGASALANRAQGFVAECGTGLSLINNNISFNYYAGVSLSAIQSSEFNGNVINSNGSLSDVNANGVEMGTSDCNPTSPPAKGAKAKKAKASARANTIVQDSPNYSDGNSFDGNTIASNTGNGVSIVGGNHNFFDGNDIRSNTLDGIRIDSEFVASVVTSPAAGNRISNGSNYGNGGKNIDLGNGTPNNRMERPTMVSAVRDTSAGTTTVTLTMPTRTGVYDIELFKNQSPGKPAGEIYVAGQRVSISSVGAPFTFVVSDTTSDNFSATATEPENGDTSEFADQVSASVIAVPAADVLPTSIDFGDIVVGRQSSQGTISITSVGTASYVISALRDSSCTGPNICSSGAFICSTGCVEGSPYATNMQCTITASFAPTALGPQTKTLALCDNTASSPRTLTFSGNGITAPEVDIVMAPTSYYFGEVLVGAQSPSKDFTVTNMGSQPVYLGNLTLSQDFVIAGNTCGSSLAAGASCGTDVAFVPSGKGVVFGSLQLTASNLPIAANKRSKVTSVASTTTVSATLEGSGVQFGDLRLPSAISFGSLVLHSSPGHQTVTITNTGNGTLSLNSISVSGPFTLTNPCPSTLASGESCTIALDFNPLALGPFGGTLAVVSDAPGGTRTIPITAQVIADSRPVVRVNPTIVGFGERTIGTESPAQRLTITNEGALGAVLGAFTFVQPQENATEFSVKSTTCTGTLAPQATCFADVILKPLGFGERNGQMVVPSNSPDSPQIVTLGGTGCRPFTAGSNRSGRDPCAP